MNVVGDCRAANYGNHHITEHLQGGGAGLTSGNDLTGTGTNESDLRVSQTATESYMTPAHYSGYDEASEYHSLPQDHQPPHPFNLDGSPEFYSASGIQIEPKYQPSPFKNYPRGNVNGLRNFKLLFSDLYYLEFTFNINVIELISILRRCSDAFAFGH